MSNKFYWIGRLFSEYLQVYQEFEKIIFLYNEGQLTYHHIKDNTDQPKGVSRGGSFYRLKETAHKTRKFKDISGLESSFLWSVEVVCSDLFHEITPIRESLYKAYRNSCEIPKLREYIETQDSNSENYDLESSLEIILQTDEVSKNQIGDRFSSLKRLIDLPQRPFKSILKIEKDNHFIKRTIHFNMDSIKKVYGDEGFTNILKELYETDLDGFNQLYIDSLENKGFYDEAKKVKNSIK